MPMTNDLAARVEALTAPSEGTFWEAFCIAFPPPDRIWEDKNCEEWTAEYENWWQRRRDFVTFLEVRAWFDAAMTLVPNDWRIAGLFQRNCRFPNWIWKAELWSPESDRNVVGIARSADVAAIALVAAALRARGEGR